MRIKKATDGLQTFENITERNIAKKYLKDGDCIKVIDASEDEQVSSGWAIYRFSIGGETLFDLLEKEEKEGIPTLIPDENTVEKVGSDNLLHVIDGLQPCPHDTVIKQDFNLTVVFDKWDGALQFSAPQMDVAARKLYSNKTFRIQGVWVFLDAHLDSIKNKYVYCAYVSKLGITDNSGVRTILGLGKFPVLDLAEDEILVALVRLKVADTLQNTNTNDIAFFKLWKKGLAFTPNQIHTMLSTSPALDCAAYLNSKVVLTKNSVINFSNLVDGMSGNMKVVQDSVGSRTLTINPTPKVINNGGGVISLSKEANAVDIISWWYDGTDLNITYGLKYN